MSIQVIVTLTPTGEYTAVMTALQQAGLTAKGSVDDFGDAAFAGGQVDNPTAMEALRKVPGVERVEEETPNFSL